jgi:hypothetical protein
MNSALYAPETTLVVASYRPNAFSNAHEISPREHLGKGEEVKEDGKEKEMEEV